MTDLLFFAYSGYACADDINYYSCVSTFASGETSDVIILSNFTQLDRIYADAQTTVSAFALNLIYVPEQPTQTAPPKQNDTRPPEEHARKGLSVGQTAAIGVCVPLAAITLLIGLFLFVRRRGSNRTTKEAQSEDADSHRKPELDGLSSPRLELDASGNPLVGGGDALLSQPPMELPGAETQNTLQKEAAELPGSDGFLPPLPLERQSPVVCRKPVTGSLSPLMDELSSFAGSGISDRGYNMEKDGSGRVVSEVSIVSVESKGRGSAAGEP